MTFELIITEDNNFQLYVNAWLNSCVKKLLNYQYSSFSTRIAREFTKFIENYIFIMLITNNILVKKKHLSKDMYM